jgi:predicted metal-dependent hydrolase
VSTNRFPGQTGLVSKKSAKIAELIAACEGRDMDAHYLGYFECFNSGYFFEAHDVLEELWLAQGKTGPNYAFYKGLIQFAGAFVHLQKDRLSPAAALFKLTRANLLQYPSPHERLDLAALLGLIGEWLNRLEGASTNPFPAHSAPRLKLIEPSACA